jgi:hypothetical protein
MAVITRVEVVNYLCEGWKPHMGTDQWRPLWPANTLRFAGQSTAIQIPNGCGKTSIATALLFLLSRDRVLKKQFLDKCAPSELGYTHVRMEFAIRTDDSLTQRDLITLSPLDIPAQTYVVGVCANRGDDDLQFYRHPGMLEDSPAYRLDGTSIRFTPNDDFRNRVRKLPKADWNRWGAIAEWRRAIGEFMTPEVVRQNVQFHKSGAGDASATFNKIQPSPGERFDETYFKQIVAPQLLSNLMGDSSQEDEQAIEDTVTISMTRFIDAKLKVERTERHLQRRESLQQQFNPVVEKAGLIQEADTEYQRQLQALGRDAAFLDYFAGGGGFSMPGVPLEGQKIQASDQVRQLLAGMALDSDGTVLVSDDTLAYVFGQSTGNLNQLAARQSTNRPPVASAVTSSQVIDFDCNIKTPEGSGGRRKATRYYDRAGALELATRRDTGTSKDAIERLSAVFDAAEQLADTNPFRHEQRRLSRRHAETSTAIAAADTAAAEAEASREALAQQVTERQENQVAFRLFCAYAETLPSELREQPLVAETWLEDETGRRQSAVIQHAALVGELTAGWQSFLGLRERHPLVPLDEQLALVRRERDDLTTAIAASTKVQAETQLQKKTADQSLQEAEVAHAKADRELSDLKALLPGDERYREIFGDVNPIEVSPPIDELQRLNRELTIVSTKLANLRTDKSRLTALQEAMVGFRALFGDVDPRATDPVAGLTTLQGKHNGASLVYNQHKPLAEALEAHMDRYGTVPVEWMRSEDAQRTKLEAQAQEIALQLAAVERELAALDDLSLVDDERYERAHRALSDAGISFTRVRDVILASTRDKDRQLAALAAFGGLLSAPVIDSLESASRAAAAVVALERDVPLLLRGPLLDVLQRETPVSSEATAALSFFVGGKTRRVRALVDPQALGEVKATLRARLPALRSSRQQALDQATSHGPHTEAYRAALQAQEAVRLNSIKNAAEADTELQDLGPQIKHAQTLTTKQALGVLSSASEFLRTGGEQSLARLIAGEEQLEGLLAETKDRGKQLERKTSGEAILAHADASKLSRAGGRMRVAELEDRVPQLLATKELALGRVAELEEAIVAAASRHTDLLTGQQLFLAGPGADIDPLEAATEFELAGHATFMASREATGRNLERSRDELKPLSKIDFKRAQSFMDHQGEDELVLQQKIGEAAGRRDEERKKAKQLRGQLERLQGEVSIVRRAAGVLHELAYVMRSKQSTVAPYLRDLETREAGASPAEAHPSYKLAWELRSRLVDWKSADGPLDLNRITALRAEIEDIDVVKTGQDARAAKRRAEAVRKEFEAVRADFCSKAASDGEDGGFSQAEIDAIQAAATIEQLKALAELGNRLLQDLDAERERLLELQKSANAVETESIRTLSVLVESCRGNLTIMNKVMARNENARFYLDAKIISDEDIKELMISLRDGIEERKRIADGRKTLGNRDVDSASLRAEVRRALVDRIFLEPSVEFRHVGMWDGRRHPVDLAMSEGQKAALQMLWLIKESEYHLERAVQRHLGGGSKKRLRSRSQRVLFFDGLFSNLSDRALIDEAFKGLGESDSSLQLIGLIHNPAYRNNYGIFPAHIVGRRSGRRAVEGERSFIKFEDGRPDGTIGLATFLVKPATASATALADHG